MNSMSIKFDTALVVDDDPDIAFAARLALNDHFTKVDTCSSPASAMEKIESYRPDVILLDMNFKRGATDGEEGFKALDDILKRDPEAVVIVITAHADVNLAVRAIKRGATDFVSKPWSNERLVSTVCTGAKLRVSKRHAEIQKQRVLAITTSSNKSKTPLIGSAPTMQKMLSLVERAAPTDANVLILGENGTGKELVARELHRRSLRSDFPMISVDLGALSNNLIESELFGHVKGAFTDARSDRIGRFQAADGGTLFLDELGTLPLHLQPKLLTALEQRRVSPVGSNDSIPVDVRVISATNMERKEISDDAVLRQDLRFRLNTIEISLPPLRDRREDIPQLIEHYLAIYSQRYSKQPRALPREVLDALIAYDWPGNVRALRHMVERAVIMAEGQTFVIEDFPLARGDSQPTQAYMRSHDDLNLERNERRFVERALKKNSFNISMTAKELGLSRSALYRRMEKHGL